MHNALRRSILIGVLSGSLLSAAGSSVADSIEDAMTPLNLIRPPRAKLTPDFTVPLLNGGRFVLSEQRGKIVVINFWATWCVPCREEMPALEHLRKQHDDSGFALVAIATDTDTTPIKPFLAKHGLTIPIGLDPRGDIARVFGAHALPITFVVGQHGMLVGTAVGPRPWDSEAVVGALRRLSRQRPAQVE